MEARAFLGLGGCFGSHGEFDTFFVANSPGGFWRGRKKAPE